MNCHTGNPGLNPRQDKVGKEKRNAKYTYIQRHETENNWMLGRLQRPLFNDHHKAISERGQSIQSNQELQV